jgi:hypothetical protein
MQITRSSIDTQNGPADSFTGDVYVDVIAAPAASSTFAAALVHFTPSARTAWHTHPHGQTIFVTPSRGAAMSPTRSTAPRRQAPTDERAREDSNL